MLGAHVREEPCYRHLEQLRQTQHSPQPQYKRTDTQTQTQSTGTDIERDDNLSGSTDAERHEGLLPLPGPYRVSHSITLPLLLNVKQKGAVD